MDNAALVISLIALLLSSFGLYIAWKTYRRDGFAVTVKLERSVQRTSIDTYTFSTPILGIHVDNTGRSDVDVKSWWFEVLGGDAIVEMSPNGPSLPTVLRGNGHLSWTSQLSAIAEAALGSARQANVRAVVQLAGDRERYSPWISLARADLSET